MAAGGAKTRPAKKAAARAPRRLPPRGHAAAATESSRDIVVPFGRAHGAAATAGRQMRPGASPAGAVALPRRQRQRLPIRTLLFTGCHTRLVWRGNEGQKAAQEGGKRPPFGPAHFFSLFSHMAEALAAAGRMATAGVEAMRKADMEGERRREVGGAAGVWATSAAAASLPPPRFCGPKYYYASGRATRRAAGRRPRRRHCWRVKHAAGWRAGRTSSVDPR